MWKRFVITINATFTGKEKSKYWNRMVAEYSRQKVWLSVTKMTRLDSTHAVQCGVSGDWRSDHVKRCSAPWTGDQEGKMPDIHLTLNCGRLIGESAGWNALYPCFTHISSKLLMTLSDFHTQTFVLCIMFTTFLVVGTRPDKDSLLAWTQIWLLSGNIRLLQEMSTSSTWPTARNHISGTSENVQIPKSKGQPGGV